MTALESIDWRSRIGQIVELVSTSLGSVVDVLYAAISSVFSVLVTSLVGLIFAVYVLVSKENLRRQWLKLTGRYLPEIWHKRLNYVLATVNDCFHRYIVGQCLEAVILGVLCAVGMWILRLPYAAMVGALIAFTALIPVAGAYIGAGVGAFMILTVSPMKALLFLVFIVVLQQLEGNIIYPRVVGSSIGLPGIWVLAAVTIGGGIMGIAGMLLGVPVTAALYRILQEDLHHRENAAGAVSPVDVPAEPVEESAGSAEE
jgi:predicted PurR-regulated permease PerM